MGNLNHAFNTAPVTIGTPVAAASGSYLSGRRRYWPSDPRGAAQHQDAAVLWAGRGPQ
jgi:hypothetical protein